MSRFSGLAAVDQYKAKLTFDRAKALQVLRDGVKQVADMYPAGALDWLQQHKSDLYAQCMGSMDKIEQAFGKEAPAMVAASVDLYVRLHKQAFELFKEHTKPLVTLKEEQHA